MKKSRSSVPRFADKWELPPPLPPRKDGLFATAGREPAELPALPAPALVAIAVGKTKDGESLPANPIVVDRGNVSLLLQGPVLIS